MQDRPDQVSFLRTYNVLRRNFREKGVVIHLWQLPTQWNPTQVSHRWAPKTCHWNSLPSLAGNRLSSYSSKDISGACGMILYNKNIKLWYYSTSPAYKVPITTVETQTQRTDLWTVWEAEEGWTERVSWGQTHHRGQSSQPLGIWCRTRRAAQCSGPPTAVGCGGRWEGGSRRKGSVYTCGWSRLMAETNTIL